ncbi:hypothetical protein NMY22_g7607 [Coprinellus aureogranulatus]|nr:hypothetical protein NMY22_g7607 [Coprinellus aureogranulatus]
MLRRILGALRRLAARFGGPLANRTRHAMSNVEDVSREILAPLPIQERVASYFAEARGFNIEQQNIHHIQNIAPSKTVFEHLQPYVSSGAAYNSAEECDAPRCSPETREAIQEEVVGLLRDGDRSQPSKKLIWLSGPAGAGKTAIAGSAAETCGRSGLLVGSFFFSSTRGSVDSAQSGIFGKRLLDQAQCLILAPLQALSGRCDISAWPRGILFDGLDEVQAVQHHDSTREDLERKDEDDQLEILEILLILARSPAFPFRILIASRPERIITDFFTNEAKAFTISLFLDGKYKPDTDIKRFLHSKFTAIRRRYGISDSNNPWPGEEAIDKLVEMSSGQFIVPSTILRYVESGLPQEQLKDIMRLERVQRGHKNPFALLDALYTHIVNRSPQPRLVAVWIRCFNSIRPVDGYIHTVSLEFWKKFLSEDTEGQFDYLLLPLASLVSIRNLSSTVIIYHKTLTDFLSSEGRCGDLYVSDDNWKALAAERCVGVLQDRGPKVPLPSQSDLNVFLKTLLALGPLFRGESNHRTTDRSQAPLPNTCALFLGYLRKPSSLIELGSCDVAWWTRLALKQDGAIEELMDLLGGMYCGIHCNWVSARQHSWISPSTYTHPCIHWRRGILGAAQVPGRRVKEWTGDRLFTLTADDFRAKLTREARSLRRLAAHPFTPAKYEASLYGVAADILGSSSESDQFKGTGALPGPARPETHYRGTDRDVSRFLRSQFAGIRRRCGIYDPFWPGEEAIGRLTNMSSGGLLAIPSIIMHYIGSGPLQRRLENILQLGPVEHQGGNPSAMLDTLYTFIINRSPNPRLAVIWIHCITSIGVELGKVNLGRTPKMEIRQPVTLHAMTSHFWKNFLEDAEGELDHILSPLSPLLSLPPTDDSTSPIRIRHASLTEFLSSKALCGDLYVGEDRWRAYTAERCVVVLKNRGPAVPLPSRANISDFFRTVLSLNAYRCSSRLELGSGSLPLFLNDLSQSSAAELATCDVAWWKRLLLTKHDTRLRWDTQVKVDLLWEMCCGIHTNLVSVSGPLHQGLLITYHFHPMSSVNQEGDLAIPLVHTGGMVFWPKPEHLEVKDIRKLSRAPSLSMSSALHLPGRKCVNLVTALYV